MADDVAAPEEVSDSTTLEEQPEPTEVVEPEGESGQAGVPEAQPRDEDQDETADETADENQEDADADPEAGEDDAQASDGEQESPKPAPSKVRLAIVVGLAAVVAMAALASWFGFHAYRSHQADQQRKLYVQVARQGAINLTTIDWEHVDADIERILNSATGTFYDDFQRRSKPFIQVVQHFQSKSVGTITAAALESESDDAAQVLVAVSVKTTTTAAPEQRPRAWRMRITVQQVGDEAKVANVEFVP
ncbi:hypothetical protein TM48_04926 [Mycobacterium shottsii]|uniref:Mce associated membrane protein n=1 Tax=Mycobacterium shottsii TaxID=133549 RepID=A0A7I7L4Y6_9MYCO|nr:Mce protein [Mycobacterium shottsii]QYL30334.1 hypothetical protein TM48_04926 [Mycobacterium shottsii]BBX54697.1 hypothetical protein MSHO_00420 [Mycobacterium shottsii]